MVYRIPFNRPTHAASTEAYALEALRSPHQSGDGPFSKKCQALLEQTLGVTKALLTTSGTHALEMCALLLEIQPGDEVIVPSFTFVSTANAFALRSCKIVFADIRPDTLNLDETSLARHITPRTRAIVPVHYGGVGCEMEGILALADRHGIAVVEDNAHGLFGKYRGRWLGSFGKVTALSFHETKNFSCGEGGAILINDPALAERGEIIREKGTDRSRFFRGQVDKYGWRDLGSSYLPSDILAAILLSNLEHREHIQARRRVIWKSYATELADWASANQVRLPVVPEHCEQAFHMFYLFLPSLESRQRLIAHLREREILAVFHYLPLHLSAYGSRWGAQPGDCPVTERVSDCLLRLPFYTGLSMDEQSSVIEAILSFKV